MQAVTALNLMDHQYTYWKKYINNNTCTTCTVHVMVYALAHVLYMYIILEETEEASEQEREE